jgi:hypothetical protein
VIELTSSPTRAELEYIVENLPDNTLRELGGQDAAKMAAEYVAEAEAAYVVYFDGLPAVLMGVTDKHFVFVVATKAAQKRKKDFMLATREMLARTLDPGRHSYVWALIPKWYKETVRWCRWLGARFGERVTDPAMGECFVITFTLADVVLGRGRRHGDRAGDSGGAVSDLQHDSWGEGRGGRL